MLRLLLWRLCPGLRVPTSFNGGQSVCSGCGSDTMLCVRLSLLTNVTWVPAFTVSVFGLTVLFVIVIVVPPPGVGSGEGDVLLPLPPQLIAAATVPATAHAQKPRA